MTLIKRIINWLIALFKKLFGKKEKKVIKVSKKSTNKKQITNKKTNLNSFSNDELPSYMIIGNHEKEMLLYSIALLKNFLEENNTKRKEQDEKKIFKLLEDKYNIKPTEIVSEKHLESLIKSVPDDDKKEIIDIYQNITKRDEEFKVHLKEVDKVINKISNEDISIIEANEIDREISNIVNDKKIDNLEEKIDYFNKNVFDIVDNIDEYFIKDVVREYQKVNYITVSTTLIDKNYERFLKLEDDFKHHRYNKYYYEREINKIKHELKQVKNLKNNKEVNEHINKLRKELYTKSKDKYDLLYNNEIFMNFDKECDLLLDKINAKVVDIKKEEKVEKKELDINKKKKLENILLRFKDMELARKYILLMQQEDFELLDKDENMFIETMYKRFNNDLLLDFNFNRNRKKTELVVLFNELNMMINKKTNEPYINLDHINFRMEDLVEAVEVKKESLDNLINDSSFDNIKATEKIESLKEKHNVKTKAVDKENYGKKKEFN